MASLFEDLGVFDRPEVPLKITIGKTKVDVIARKPSAFEQDAIDAFEMDEYGRLITESTLSKDGNLSEMDRVRNIYKTRPKTDIVEQLLPTRGPDINRLTLELAGVDIGEETLKMREMSETELADYAKQRDADMKSFEEAAKEQVRSELLLEDYDSLVERLTQVNVNVKANRLSRIASTAYFLYYTLYRPAGKDEGKRAFDSPDEVRKQFTGETILSIANEVRNGLVPDPTAPFDSPVDPEPSGHSSSPSTSEPETKDSGDSTVATPAV